MSNKQRISNKDLYEGLSTCVGSLAILWATQIQTNEQKRLKIILGPLYKALKMLLKRTEVQAIQDG